MLTNQHYRGYAIGQQDIVEFAINESTNILKKIYTINGINYGAQTVFFDSEKNKIGFMPCLTSPVETQGRATMLAINSITKENKNIEYVLFLSAVNFSSSNSMGTIIHFESRANSSITTDLLFQKQKGKPFLLDNSFYAELFGENPFLNLPIFGFFDEPEFIIRNSERDIFTNGKLFTESELKTGKKLAKSYVNLKKYFLH